MDTKYETVAMADLNTGDVVSITGGVLVRLDTDRVVRKDGVEVHAFGGTIINPDEAGREFTGLIREDLSWTVQSIPARQWFRVIPNAA